MDNYVACFYTKYSCHVQVYLSKRLYYFYINLIEESIKYIFFGNYSKDVENMSTKS